MDSEMVAKQILSGYDSWLTRMETDDINRFGFNKLIDWDREAMTAIEGINSAPGGNIDRSSNPMWKTHTP